MKNVRPSSPEELVFVGMLFGIAHVLSVGILQSRRRKESLVQLSFETFRESYPKRSFVAESFVNCGRRASRFTRNRSEGEPALPASSPQPLGGFQDAFLQVLVRLWWHGPYLHCVLLRINNGKSFASLDLIPER